MSNQNFMLNSVEHEESFITSGPDLTEKLLKGCKIASHPSIYLGTCTHTSVWDVLMTKVVRDVSISTRSSLH